MHFHVASLILLLAPGCCGLADRAASSPSAIGLEKPHLIGTLFEEVPQLFLVDIRGPLDGFQVVPANAPTAPSYHGGRGSKNSKQDQNVNSWRET